jgi:transcriptional regulator with XRE-family HTH domain
VLLSDEDGSPLAQRSIGERVRYFREERGLGVRELARLAEVNASIISRLESGERAGLSLENAGRLARVLGISLHMLRDGKESPDECAEVVTSLASATSARSQTYSDAVAEV